VILFGNISFISEDEVILDEMGCCPKRQERRSHRTEAMRRPGRDWSYAATAKEYLQSQGGDKEGLFSRAFRKNEALLPPQFQTFDLPNCARINICCFKPPNS
jgi:hypothetical protein